MGFAIRLHESVGMGDGYTVDATGTTGASSRVDEIVSGVTAGFVLGGSVSPRDPVKRFSLLT